MEDNWTFRTLKIYFEKTIVDLKEYFERILIEKDKAINIALAAAKEAVAVAEANAEKWRSNANEWRQAMNDKDKLLMPRTEVQAMIKSLDDKFEAYKKSMEIALSVEKSRTDENEFKGAGKTELIGYIVTAIVVTGIIVGIVVRFL